MVVFAWPAFWWLEHYEGFRKHLEERYQLLVHQDETCLIYALHESEAERRDVLAQGGLARTATIQDGRA